MKIKEGSSWKAGCNEEKGLYGAEVIFHGDWDYYEISAGVYNSLTNGMSDSAAEELIRTGRHLYSHINDRMSPPYTVVLDEDYADYCPWLDKNRKPAGMVWDENLTDAAVELFESEKDNREQRRKKREAREKKKKG